MMTTNVSNKMLKAVLIFDAVTCFAFGLLLCLGGGLLASHFGLPADLLIYAGIILFPCSVLMFVTAKHARPALALVWLIILGNLGWVLASITILVLPIGTPTVIGYGFVSAQALAVLGIAALEYRAIAQHSLSSTT
ncbi:hypothetical protein ACFOY8_15825 [Thalassospira xianhensis]|nr:hypothetical protein L6172_15655 [Thalassospiraceae bacterium SW-3-3]